MLSFLLEPQTWMIRVVLGLIIFVVALILGKILGKVVEKVISNIGITALVQKATNTSIKIETILGGIVSYTIYFLGFVMALNQIGITTTVLNLISGAVLILFLIVVFLSSKDILPNIAAGFLIHGKNLVEEGDVLKIHDIEGIVIQTTLVDTRVKTKKGDMIFIPNARLVKYEDINNEIHQVLYWYQN